MKRFWLFLLRLYGAIVVLCALVVCVQRLSAPADVLAKLGVDLCGDNLCMEGLVPGFVRWDLHMAQEMEKQYKVHPQLGGAPVNDSALGSYSGVWMAYRYIGERHIALGDFMARFGDPLCITHLRSYDVVDEGQTSAEVIKLHYQLVTVAVMLSPDAQNRSSAMQFDPHLDIIEVEITNQPYLAYYNAYNCSGIGNNRYQGQNSFNLRWQGFVSIDKYLDSALNGP